MLINIKIISKYKIVICCKGNKLNVLDKDLRVH